MTSSHGKLSLVRLPKITLQPASQDIWDKKYRLKTENGQSVDHSVKDTLKRIAKALAAVETEEKRAFWQEQFLWALEQGAVPAGRIVSNAGAREHKPATSTINCTVSDTIRDSMNDILTSVHKAGLTLKAGCGIGYEFSSLRPKGAFVAGAGASTSGPLSFMDIFDAMCRTIASAGNRRGAQMATFDVSHPDIIDFIRAKREDGRLRQFNLSCLISEDFIRAVKEKRSWPLSFPIQSARINDDPEAEIIYRPWPISKDYQTNNQGEVACRVWRHLKAQTLWDIIMRSTYDFSEPGFILIDRVNQMNNLWFCEEIRATNPCVTADTWVHTDHGARQVADLLGKQFTALIHGQRFSSTSEGFFATGVKPTVQVTTKEGFRLRLTKDHKVLCQRRATKQKRSNQETFWLEAGMLTEDDQIVLHDHRKNISWSGDYGFEEGYLLGLLVGDGTLKKDKAILSVWKTQQVVNGSFDISSCGIMETALNAAQKLPHRKDFSGWYAVAKRNEYRLSTAAIKDLAYALGLRPGKKGITPAMERTSSAFYQGFLRALFDADGSVQGTHKKGGSIRLAQSSKKLLQAVQRMLFRLGIVSKIYQQRRPAQLTLLPDGKGGKKHYPTQAQHELIISNENIIQFSATIGFAAQDKALRLRDLVKSYRRKPNREQFLARVQSVIEKDPLPVFDVQIPGIHAFDANGLYVHNCGEQPLPPHGACLLGSVNLTRFVEKPFTKQATFDWQKYKKVVRIFTRMLDNVVELHGLPLEEQAKEIFYKRRHGMGFFGLGSALTMLKMVYGDQSSIDFTEKVAKEMAITGWEIGLELAEEKGAAPIMDDYFPLTPEILRKSPQLAQDGFKVGDKLPGRVLIGRYSRYLQQFPEALRQAIAERGCRFTHHTSIAPTGTIALSLGNNASNGIEPSFAHKYSRNIIQEGRKSKEKVTVYSYELLSYRAVIDSKADPEQEDGEHKLPDYFIDANTVTPKSHIDIQAATQKWIDSSISKTINVPTDYPYEDFKQIYLYAFDKGLKGCTTFRFNPEAFQGVLVKDSDLKATRYRFTLENGETVDLQGDEIVIYDGEEHTAANLFDALKEGYYGKL
ncbi:LAGLIDADG family homing endonuclease [Magnetococcales bacterium HHB-1]